MNIITEQDIEDLIDLYDKNEDLFPRHRQMIIDDQPAVSALLTQEDLDLLTDDEYDLLWFITTIVFQAFTIKNDTGKVIQPELLEKIEEKNWDIFNGLSASSFVEKLDHFFEKCPQEDLLDFIEISLDSDEDMEISQGAREVIFVSVFSILEALMQTVKD